MAKKSGNTSNLDRSSLNNTQPSSKFPTPKRSSHLGFNNKRYLNNSRDEFAKTSEFDEIKREEVNLHLKPTNLSFSSPYRKDEKSN